MRRILQPIRFVVIIVSMFTFLFTMSTVWCFVRGKWRRVRWSNWILTGFSRWGLWVLNLKVDFVGLDRVAKHPNGLFVGNHLSYMDILVIHSRIPTCFVTSTEIRETPVLGQICKMAGCLFVERRNKLNIHNEVSEIAEGLRQGLNVAIFPESTSTNGEQILRFRRPLYVAAMDAEKPIIPMCLNYRQVGGQPINRVTRDMICWYGDMDFAPHLWALAGSGGVRAELNFLEPILPTENDDATLLAERSQHAVESVFSPIR